MAFDYLALFKAVHDQWTNVRTTTNCWCVAERLGCFLDSFNQKALVRAPVAVEFGLHAGQRASANQGPGPGAKILGAKISSHHFLDIKIDVAPLHIDKGIVAVPVFEDVPARLLQQLFDDPGSCPVAKLAALLDPGLTGKIKNDSVAFDRDVLGPQSGETIAAILARIDFTAGPDKTQR